MSDYSIWDSFQQGQEIGGRIRARRQQDQYGDAYASGGLDALNDAAGRNGDIETMAGADRISQGRRQFQDQQHQQVFDTLEKASQWVLPVIRRARQLPADQREAFLRNPQFTQRFEALGFNQQQIDNAIRQATDPAGGDQFLDELGTGFTAHRAPDWQLDPTTGQVYAVDPNSDTGAVITGGEAPGAANYQAKTNAEIYHLQHPSVGGQYAVYGAPRPMTDEEAQQWNIPDPDNYMMANGRPTPIQAPTTQPQPTQQQSIAQASLARMDAAESELSADDTTTRPNQVADAVSEIPLIGQAAGQALRGPELRRQRNSQQAWTEAYLRATTGAAFTAQELQTAMETYWPMPGDSADDVARKARLREAARGSIQGIAPPSSRPRGVQAVREPQNRNQEQPAQSALPDPLGIRR